MNAVFPIRPLSEVATRIDYGVTASASAVENGTKFLRITDIQDGAVDWQTVPFCEAPPNKLRSAQLSNGDTVFARTGATTGKSFLIQSPPDGAVFASYLIRVRPSASVNPAYLAHFFQSKDYWSQIQRKTQGAAQGGVNASSLSEIEIPLPPLDEQRRIAAILDKANALRHKRKRALYLLESLTHSIFQRTFVEQGSEKWPEHFVESLARDVRTGPFGSQLLHSEFVDDGVAVLGIDNAVANEFRWGERRYISLEKYAQLRRYTVSPGDVLITIMGTCGRCAIVPEDIPVAINTKHLCCITLDKEKCLPEFLQATFLQHPDVLQQLGVQAKGAVMPGLNMSIIKSLSISLPPIDLQRAFAAKISKLKTMLASSRAAELKTANLFSSLQSRAFSGQL